MQLLVPDHAIRSIGHRCGASHPSSEHSRERPQIQILVVDGHSTAEVSQAALWRGCTPNRSLLHWSDQIGPLRSGLDRGSAEPSDDLGAVRASLEASTSKGRCHRATKTSRPLPVSRCIPVLRSKIHRAARPGQSYRISPIFPPRHPTA